MGAAQPRQRLGVDRDPSGGADIRRRSRVVHPLTEPADVRDRVATLTRDSYGKLLAILVAPTRDIAAAEDALADALERALARWPFDGIPTNPEGWVLTVARNRLRDLW